MAIVASIRRELKKLYIDKVAQDLIEYALMPGVSTNISKIWSKVANMMQDSANTPNG